MKTHSEILPWQRFISIPYNAYSCSNANSIRFCCWTRKNLSDKSNKNRLVSTKICLWEFWSKTLFKHSKVIVLTKRLEHQSLIMFTYMRAHYLCVIWPSLDHGSLSKSPGSFLSKIIRNKARWKVRKTAYLVDPLSTDPRVDVMFKSWLRMLWSDFRSV